MGLACTWPAPGRARPARPRARRASGPWHADRRERAGPSGLIGARAGASRLRAMLAIPLDRAAEPFLERRRGGESEGRRGARGVEHAARLTVGLRGIPDDLAAKIGEPRDEPDQIGDPDLETGADVH